MEIALVEADPQLTVQAEHKVKSSAALEVIATVAELVVHYEHRLEAQSERLVEYSRRTRTLEESANAILDRLKQQDQEYAVLMEFFRRKSLECAMLKIALERSNKYNEECELHTRAVTKHIVELQQEFRR